MEYYFSAKEIAQKAMMIEDAGHRFYVKMASMVENSDVRKIFLILAKAEEEHKNTFENMKNSIPDNKEVSYSIDVGLLMQAHMDKIENDVFENDNFSKKVNNVEEAVNIALYIEKEAIRIYLKMLNVFMGQFKELLNGIIEEEKKHMQMLANVKATMTSPEKEPYMDYYVALNIALEKEEEAAEHYKHLAVKYPAMRELFEFLMVEEQKHAKIIKKKIAELGI